MAAIIEDTARNNLASWTSNAISDGLAVGAMISPFAQPWTGNGYKQDAVRVAESIAAAGGQVWFDPATHALQMPNVGDFRYYDQWSLWSSRRNELTTPTAQDDHINRVVAAQDALGAIHLAPTILLTGAGTLLSRLAIDISTRSRPLIGDTGWLSISGDTHFWSSGLELDAHIGALNQLAPAGWHISVARSTANLPAPATAQEIEGLMRTVFALSMDRPVMISHGDIAALPAVAAGAGILGTGWDTRQRVLAYSDYVERPNDPDAQGQWFTRPTVEGLVATIKQNPFDVLHSEQPQLARRITPGTIGPGAENPFKHHLGVLNRIVDQLTALAGQDRVGALRQRYVDANGNWALAARVASIQPGAAAWIDPVLQGLENFARAEGWTW